MLAPAAAAASFRVGSPVVILFYACVMVQGLLLVSFPALSVVLTGAYALTSAQYGAIFLPQVGCAVIGALLGGGLAQRLGLKALLTISLAAGALSQALLALLPILPADWVFPCVLAGTAALGLGFGFSGAPMNSYPPAFFPARSHGAVVAAHTLVGFGLAIGPLIAGEFVRRGAWVGFPAALAVLAACLAVLAALGPLPACRAVVPAGADGIKERPVGSQAFWVFVAIVVLYAFAEGTFSSWAVIYLRDDRGLPEMTASWALSAFWGALVIGRLLASALVARIAPEIVWAFMPLLMIAAFLLLPTATGGPSGIALFALAGLACSAFLPLSITLASHRFPDNVAWVSSMLIAALMVGVGVGSFAVGALRERLTFADLYTWSALYPALALALAIPILRWARRAAGTH